MAPDQHSLLPKSAPWSRKIPTLSCVCCGRKMQLGYKHKLPTTPARAVLQMSFLVSHSSLSRRRTLSTMLSDKGQIIHNVPSFKIIWSSQQNHLVWLLVLQP